MSNSFLRTVCALASAFLLLASTPRAVDDDLLGFTPAHAAAQHQLEARFDGLLSPQNLDRWMQRLTAKPQHIGSPHGHANALFVDSLFRSWGYDTSIDTFMVLFPTPKERLLEMVSPVKFTARLGEPAIEEDASTSIREDMLPPYNAYSVDGDVTGDLVYVNYGVPDDYEELAQRGVDVKGKIVLARYGGSWRGIKPKVAAEHGAVGCIIYSDPRDDGYFEGDVYPEGPYRNENGAQRGSVEDLPLYPGDPLTPGIGATADAKRLPREEAPSLTKIPVLPISYADALPLLKALEGPVVPEEWRGALPLTYHMGPGPARVHLKLAFDWQLVPAYDVVARMPGRDYPDEWVIRGNHRDAWVFGAADPTSGHVAMLEEARAVGELAKSGWRPRRTIVYASWDGEEPGLLGSTEWAETHAVELRQKAVAYINTDGYGRGFIGAGGSQTLERFFDEVARDVRDPETGVSVAARRLARDRVQGNADDAERTHLELSPLGSGSDYSPFLQHLGIASLNVGFGGEDGGGSYHSAYDTYEHFSRFGDPGFAYGVALAQVGGRLVLRLADADVLPFTFSELANHVGDYVEEVTKLADDMRTKTEHRNALLADSAYVLAADPTKTYVPPKVQDAVPYLNFAPLQNALVHLTERAKVFDAGYAAKAATLSPEKQDALNDILMHVEQHMTLADGLPRRPWYRHQIYAPGFYTGYGVKTLPGVREAIEQRNWTEAAEQVEIVARTLESVAAEINRSDALLRQH